MFYFTFFCHYFSSRLGRYVKKTLTKKVFHNFLKTRYRGFFLFMAIFFLLDRVQENFRIIQSTTPPQSYFLQVRHLSPRIGHYILFCNKQVSQNVIRQVAGKGGDILWYDGNGVLWLNERKIGKPHAKSEDGFSLTPVLAGVIPAGFVFLYDPHSSQGFDSRYQEFGLISQVVLRGRLLPLSLKTI